MSERAYESVEARVYRRLGMAYHPMQEDVIEYPVLWAFDVVLDRLDALEQQRQRTYPDTIVEAAVRAGRQCEACAQGEPCERLERMTRAAWRQGEAATDG